MTSPFTEKDPHFSREAHKYVNPIPSREFIMQYLEEIGRPVTRGHLIQAFGLDNDETQEALRRRLIAMLRDGQLMKNRRGSFVLVKQADLICGRVEKHKDGFGFLIPDDGSDDIFLSAKEARRVMPGDKILVSVTSEVSNHKREGIVVEILERGTKQVVGYYLEEGGVAFVTPIKKEIVEDIIIPPSKQLEAKTGQIVVADIIEYPTFRSQAIGEVTEILGEKMTPGMEIEVAIRSYELPAEWSDEAKDEFEKLPDKLTPEALEKRVDLQDLPFVTIDGEDAKDFDDAVYCVPQEQEGGWLLHVAIADVSYYVKSFTVLDQEAFARGNSVYFPGHVVPMLPELLSNDLCSLRPNVPRLALVCEMRIDKDGNIKRYRFYEGVIKSHARLTYNLVYDMLEGQAHEHLALKKHLIALRDVYKALFKQRSKRGALEFTTTETKIIFDDERKIKQINPVKLNYVHGMIEECMLAANVCTSKFLDEAGIAALYRVHEEPDADKIESVRRFLGNRGLKLGGGMHPDAIHYAEVITASAGRPDEDLIQEVLLRSMKKAVYVPENTGHFGLAYKSYAQFTSPIRRYPDLLNHRAIRWLLKNTDIHEFIYDDNDMRNFGEHCSMTERRADKATGDVINWLKCQFMQNKLGEEFSGIITNVTNFGVFVELQDIYVTGLLHVTSLYNDYYHYDPINYSLLGKRSGFSYNLGDSIKVRVARVDEGERTIDFELLDNG